MFEKYFQRFGYQNPVIQSPVDSSTSIIVVIPCFNEPDLLGTLESLEQADSRSVVEVIIVVNQAEGAVSETASQNQKTIRAFQEWNKQMRTHRYFLIEALDLPKKKSGVGLARKIGMDEAAHRLDSKRNNSFIVCLDADCRVDQNYFQAIDQHLKSYPQSPGCSLYFEHPIEGEDYDEEIYAGIINYELFLRFYTHVQRKLDLPYAYHTVGSSMAVKPAAYMKQGGMNKRKAGEDFYFIHKIIQLGGFTVCNTTCVRPSPRVSDRVPFGTGKAIGDWIDEGSQTYYTYATENYLILKDWLKEVSHFFEGQPPFSGHPVFDQFLKQIGVKDAIQRIKENTSNQVTQMQKFYQWFDAFQLMKAFHFLRDHNAPNILLVKAAGQLIDSDSKDPRLLLENYRAMDRST